MKAAKRPPILRTSAAALLALAALSSVPLHGTVLTWTGVVDNKWETNAGSAPTNWIPAVLTPFTDPGVSDLIFTGNVNTNSVNDQPPATALNSITFDANAAKFTLSGQQVLFQGGAYIINNSPNLQVISFVNNGAAAGILLSNTLFLPPNTLIPTATFTANTADLLITSDIAFNSPLALTVNGAHNTTITGNISDTGVGGGTLVKAGSGTLLLTGNNTFLGSTTVNGGVLRVDGSIASLKTSVNPGGTLAGRGLIGGNVLNNGNVAPGNGSSTGTLTIKGNYTQGGNGTLTINIAGSQPGQYSTLAVQKQAQLAGNLRLVQVGGAPRLKVGQKIDIVTATGGVVGTFDNISNPFKDTGTLLTNEVVYGPNTVSLEGAQGSFSGLNGLTPNQKAVAGALDKLAFHNRAPRLIAFLDNEALNKLPGDLDKIAPEELTSIFQIGVSLANIQTANIQRRTGDIHDGSHGFSAAGFAAAGSGPVYSGGAHGPSGDDGKESKEMKTIAPPEDRWGVFITGVGEWVNVSGDQNARGYDITTGGFTLGADYKVTPNFAVGLSAGYAGTGSDLNNGGRVFVNGGKLGLYATYFTGGFYVDTAVNGGYNSYDTRRAALQGTARGDTDGGELNVLAATGYDFKAGGFSFGPTASFQYTYLGISGYDEHGSLAPLHFGSQHQDSLRTAFGLKASYDWKIGGILIKPEVRAAWQHEFGDNSYALDSSLGSGAGFSVNGPVIGRDSLLLGAGFAIMWNERTSTYVYYDGELGRENFESNAVSGGVRISF